MTREKHNMTKQPGFSKNQKPILSISYDNQLDKFTFVCEIPASESVSAGFRFNFYTGEKPRPYLKIENTQSGKPVCIFTAERNDLFRRLQSVKSDEVSCDYSLISDPTARSLMSDKYNMRHFFPEPTQPPTTNRPTTASLDFSTLITTRPLITKLSTVPLKPTTTEEKSTRGEKHKMTKQPGFPKRPLFVLLLIVTGVCVLLAGLMIICLCRFIKKQAAARLELSLNSVRDF
ncbi:uncharacterized protein Hap1MRO34_024814 [Clarias gariepinus]